MKKYFIYELKKNLLPLVIVTAFACVVYLIGVLTADFRPKADYYLFYTPGYIPGSLIAIPLVALMILCTWAPIHMFSFKMSARQADCFYSLPIRREKIYLVKSAVGLILSLAPYTIAYWLGFIVTATKPNEFILSAFVPVYFISIPLAVLLFGVNAFVFTRANRRRDGTNFILLYACAGALLAAYVYKLIISGNGAPLLSVLDFSYWFTYSPLTWLTTKYTAVISGREAVYNLEWLLYLFAALTGAAAWAGLFLTARKEKAENAERVSDSLFGYRILIPFYLAFALALLEWNPSSGFYFIAATLFAIGAIVLYIVFRRSFRLKAADWISLGVAFSLGMILSLV